MADLEMLVNELPKLVNSLKLTIGNSHEIMQQIVKVNSVQEQLRNIQKLITQELRFAQIKNSAIATLPRLGTVASLFSPSVCLVNTAITSTTGFITEKFGNPETEVSFKYLYSKIDSWMEWGDLLQAIATDILSDSQLVNQINSGVENPSLPTKFQAVSESFKIDLAFGEFSILQQQIQQIINEQEELSQLQQRLDRIINTMKNSQNLLTMLLGVSSFYGKSGFALEWLDDEHELIISSDGKVRELTDIINECEFFQEQIFTLIIESNDLREQAKQALINSEQEISKEPVINNQVPKSSSQKQKVVRSTLVIASTLVALGFNSWIIQDKIPQVQQIILSHNQEKSAVANFISAQKLGIEASSLAQNPPHPLTVWQEAKTKWQQAINLLNSIPEGTSVSNLAKKKLARYQINYTAVNQKVLNEKKAVTNFESAQKLAIEAAFFVQNSPRPALVSQQAKDKWQQAINLLESIPEDTFVFQQAKETLPNYKTNYITISTLIQE
jgi:hypothetical protein